MSTPNQTTGEEKWRLVEKTLDEMGWRVTPNSFRKAWRFELILPQVTLAFQLPDEALRAFRRERGLPEDQLDAEADVLWLNHIEALAMKWLFAMENLLPDFYREAGLPEELNQVQPPNITSTDYIPQMTIATGTTAPSKSASAIAMIEAVEKKVRANRKQAPLVKKVTRG